MWVSKERKVTFRTPEEYRRDVVPAEYYRSGGSAHIPFDCANGASATFTESATPTLMPASFVINFGGDTIARNGWRLEDLLSLFRAVVVAFRPDVAEIYDEAHRDRSTYDERMFDIDMKRVPLGLFWINYYGPEWARNVGRERLERLRPTVASLEWQDNGGVLVAIQDVPYDESNAVHRDHQLELERLLGLEELQASFPNPGV